MRRKDFEALAEALRSTCPDWNSNPAAYRQWFADMEAIGSVCASWENPQVDMDRFERAARLGEECQIGDRVRSQDRPRPEQGTYVGTVVAVNDPFEHMVRVRWDEVLPSGESTSIEQEQDLDREG